MKVLRTPDERFANLPGFPFEPHYIDVPSGDGDTLRFGYVDEGSRDADPLLLVHGEPTWSYLYRKMIPILVEAGHRTVAPDLIGFGRSDKPARREDYTYQRHVDWTWAWLDLLGLRNITLVCHDWGGLIGLRLAAEHQDRFKRIVAVNTGLATGDRAPGEAFLDWQRYSQETTDFHVGGIVKGACVTELSAEVIAAYDAPVPDARYKEGARQFPVLVPTSPDDPAAPANRKAWEVLLEWDKPFLTAFSDQDPVMRGGERPFQSRVPGAKGQPHATITNAGHFLQEDKGEELARVVVDFVART